MKADKFRFTADAYVSEEWSKVATESVNVYTKGLFTLRQGVAAISKGIRGYMRLYGATEVTIHVYIYGKNAGIVKAHKEGRKVVFDIDLYNLDWAISKEEPADLPWESEEASDSTPATMNANGTLATLPAIAVRVAAANLLPAKYFDEDFTPETANVEYLRSMLEDYVFEYDITPAQLNEAANCRPHIFKAQTA